MDFSLPLVHNQHTNLSPPDGSQAGQRLANQLKRRGTIKEEDCNLRIKSHDVSVEKITIHLASFVAHVKDY